MKQFLVSLVKQACTVTPSEVGSISPNNVTYTGSSVFFDVSGGALNDTVDLVVKAIGDMGSTREVVLRMSVEE